MNTEQKVGRSEKRSRSFSPASPGEASGAVFLTEESMFSALASRAGILRSRAGFTLIELIVVLFCMVIAASIVVPRYMTFQRSGQAKDTARNVLAYLREAREIAIEKQKTVVVSLNSESRDVMMEYDESSIPILEDSGSGGSGGEKPAPPIYYPEAVLVGIQSDASSGIQTVSAVGNRNNSQSSSEISFTPDGQANDANVLVLYDSNKGFLVTVRRQGTQLAIQSPQEASMSSLRGGL